MSESENFALGRLVANYGGVLMVAALAAAIVCVKREDPLERVGFAAGSGSGRLEGIIVFAKPAIKRPVAIYLYGAGGNLLGSGRELQTLAELGFAAVGVEYCQTNEMVFDEQFRAVLAYVARQPWALADATAWVGFSLGAQRQLGFLLRHPELAPQLLVRLGGGWVGESGAAGRLAVAASRVLLVHGEADENFPVADCRRLAELLKQRGAEVALHIVPGVGHAFGEEFGAVFRAAGEYCAAELPLADYTSALPGCSLDATEAARFNDAMRRAGQHRRELWRAVASLREPERHTAMNVIGGLEDYDLAHIRAGQLQALVQNAWKMRKTHPWCRMTPLPIFERFAASPRIFEERLDDSLVWLHGRMRRELKYCHSQRQVIDTLWRWMRARNVPDEKRNLQEGSAGDVLAAGGWRDCKSMTMFYDALLRSAGLAVRPAFSIDRDANHHWTEIWQGGRWAAYDGGSVSRAFEVGWGRPLSVIMAPIGERGGWDAERDGRWEAFTNNIAWFFPSGKVVVRVLHGGQPSAGRLVGALTGRYSPRMVERAWTDGQGEARFTLGMSQVLPYRFVLADTVDGDWEWLQVKSNAVHEVMLQVENRKLYDSAEEPPSLVFRQ